MKSMRNIVLTILLFCFSILAWELIVRAFEVPSFIFPAPSAVATALWRGFASGLYQKHLYHTLVETVLGFLLGSALGFSLGTAVALNRYVEYFFYPYIVMFQSLPKVALAPLIVVWFGLGLQSQVVNAALVAFFPLLVNTMVGLKSTDEDRMNLMRSLAAIESGSTASCGRPTQSSSSPTWRASSESRVRPASSIAHACAAAMSDLMFHSGSGCCLPS